MPGHLLMNETTKQRQVNGGRIPSTWTYLNSTNKKKGKDHKMNREELIVHLTGATCRQE